MELKERKNSLRQRMLVKRQGLSPEVRKAKEQNIQKHCLELSQKFLKPKDFVAVYRALPGEVSLDDWLFSHGYQWLFPKVSGQDLLFFHCMAESDFEIGNYGIKEPKSYCKEVPISQCPLIFVPGVAFDRRGRRLGMGKGYYDKSLTASKGLKVGVAYQCQIIKDELPHEPHDLFMDFIITENFTFSPIHWKRTS